MTPEERGRIIRAARINAGISAKRLQEMTGVHRVTTYNLERGKVKKPHPITIKAIANALNIGDDIMV